MRSTGTEHLKEKKGLSGWMSSSVLQGVAGIFAEKNKKEVKEMFIYKQCELFTHVKYNLCHFRGKQVGIWSLLTTYCGETLQIYRHTVVLV